MFRRNVSSGVTRAEIEIVRVREIKERRRVRFSRRQTDGIVSALFFFLFSVYLPANVSSDRSRESKSRKIGSPCQLVRKCVTRASYAHADYAICNPLGRRARTHIKRDISRALRARGLLKPHVLRARAQAPTLNRERRTCFLGLDRVCWRARVSELNSSNVENVASKV